MGLAGQSPRAENRVARAIVFGEDVSLASGLERQLAGKRSFRTREHRNGASKEAPRQPTFKAASSFILKALQENHWNRRKTAEDLHMSYRSLLYRLREVGVHLPRRSHRRFPSRH